ncbi:hypothetical protein F0Q45_09380 [Mycobacterium simiae]|uniref:ESX-1 secretion-associated protein EspJ n=1 Tax=Mycobacterium simiae TaxID=1784 RepID=A0A5B1BRV9_MYCSI|nr:hypothetical protein [Mycobacterium simiae]KAA1250515.1 hypothetical protein F0Q45_09380 [Mycobacterium simiae]
MAEPLAVNPTRLVAAGSKLAELVFPTLPAPLIATGSDPVSAAINETMPGIESLVSDGLPGVSAALKRTATSMSAAAEVYTQADQSLGEALAQYQFSSAGLALTAGGIAGAAASLAGPSGQSLTAPAAQLLGAPMGAASQLSQAVGVQAEALAPRVAATVPQLVQLAPQAGQMAQQASPIAQTISQSAQQAASQGAGAAPAQLASDTKPDQQAQLVDEKEKDDTDEEATGEAGAAAGAATLVSAPVRGTAAASSSPITTPV